jgi:hypothetical protein
LFCPGGPVCVWLRSPVPRPGLVSADVLVVLVVVAAAAVVAG